MNSYTHSMASGSVYEPILPTTNRQPTQQQQKKKKRMTTWRASYGGFEYQKRVWESTARRSSRIRIVAVLQLVLGVLSSWNYLWYVCMRMVVCATVCAGLTDVLCLL